MLADLGGPSSSGLTGTSLLHVPFTPLLGPEWSQAGSSQGGSTDARGFSSHPSGTSPGPVGLLQFINWHCVLWETRLGVESGVQGTGLWGRGALEPGRGEFCTDLCCLPVTPTGWWRGGAWFMILSSGRIWDHRITLESLLFTKQDTRSRLCVRLRNRSQFRKSEL